MGPELIVVLAVSVLAALVVAALVARGQRARRRELDLELADARRQVEALGRRLEEVSEEVAQARGGAVVPRPSEYVITTLGELDEVEDLRPVRRASVPLPAVSPGRLVEERLVGTLQRYRDGSRLRDGAVSAAVKVVAASHGVRRALRPEVRDRAAAEAYVARRRSRRARRQELREARRLLRVVRARAAQAQPGEDAA